MTDTVRLSKRLSLHLRHRPDLIGVELDPNGWVDVDLLLAALSEHGSPVTRSQLDAVVAGSDKQRFAYDDSGQRIRANQGHTVTVDLTSARTGPRRSGWGAGEAHRSSSPSTPLGWRGRGSSSGSRPTGCGWSILCRRGGCRPSEGAMTGPCGKALALCSVAE